MRIVFKANFTVRSGRGTFRLDLVQKEQPFGGQGAVIEQGEYVEPPVWRPNGVTIAVIGSDDEAEGEAEAYFECEAEHSSAGEELEHCFAEATQDLDEPATWSREFLFEIGSSGLTLQDESHSRNE